MIKKCKSILKIYRKSKNGFSLKKLYLNNTYKKFLNKLLFQEQYTYVIPYNNLYFFRASFRKKHTYVEINKYLTLQYFLE